MAAWSPAAAVPLVRGTHQLPPLKCTQCMFSSHPEAGAQSNPNPQNLQKAVGECVKFKLNQKNLRRRELSSSQQALKEEIKGRPRLQIFMSVPKY
ncbi:bolA-like protein 3 [Ovis aries]|uniref:bolA-like protein 3 n=1 Tax=Ovis aries TaxID=9940 RepID=UPI001C2E2F28|nr:bolA-like protein 3 [Ovis aries]